MDDLTMIRLAQNYLRQVGEIREHGYPSYEHLLQHCVTVYNRRKEIGLEQ